jgi:hypothetical protein
MSLTIAEISALLKPAAKGYPRPPQFGPLRWFDSEMRCACRGCSSPTMLKLNGVARCSVHAMKMMNEMLTSDEEKKDLQYEKRAFCSGFNWGR